MKMWFRFWVSPMVIGLSLVGCSVNHGEEQVTQIPTPELSSQHFGVKPDMPTPEEIFALPLHEQTRFLRYYHDALQHPSSPQQGHQALFHYLERDMGRFDYHHGTFTASQTLSQRNGNCLSLAILTTAYAKLVALDYEFVSVTSAPVFLKGARFSEVSTHVLTRLYRPDDGGKSDKVMVRRANILIDYFPTRSSVIDGQVSESQLIAGFFVNWSSSALQQERFDEAGWYALEALNHDPQNIQALNNLGVTYRYLAQAPLSEKAYQYGLAIEPDNLKLLFNYSLLLRAQGREQQARAVRSRIETSADSSPFDWLYLAESSLNRGRYEAAIRYFDKVIAVAPYLHQAHAGIGRAYALTGKPKLAEKAFERALMNTHDNDSEAKYQAKLSILSER